MTVCIAAITEYTSLVGVSDRMLTAGNIEFEPGQSKIWPMTTSIFALAAGDAALQADILKPVENEIIARVSTSPQAWFSVREAATLYCKKYRELLRHRAESEILHPIGLDLPTFLAKQTELNPQLVTTLSDQLQEFQFTNEYGEPIYLETIFLGIDNDGPAPNGQSRDYAHIYVTAQDKMTCYDTVGFAAIGGGKSHAESQFMFSGYWRGKTFPEAVFTSYVAKKRAEVAPGVGEATDMVVMAPGFQQRSLKVDDIHLQALEKIYRSSQRKSQSTVLAAQKDTKDYIDKILKPEHQQGTQPPTQSNSQTSAGSR